MTNLVTALVSLLCLGLELCAQEVPMLRDHYEGTSALAREHQYHASLSGKVLQNDGAPMVAATVLVMGHQPHYWALPLCRTSTDENGNFHCGAISGSGRAFLWIVTPAGLPFATKATRVNLVSGRHTELRPTIMPEAQGEALPATTFRGQVLAKDGRPVASALLRLEHAEEQFDPSCYAFTDLYGRFAIPVRSGKPTRAKLFVGSDVVEIDHADGVETLATSIPNVRLDLTGERTLQVPSIVWLRRSQPLPEGAELSLSIGGLLQPCLNGYIPVIQKGRGAAAAQVLATKPGHLARSIQLPREAVSFDEDVARELQVVDAAGKPIANAVVDLVEQGWHGRFQERLLAAHRTAADGVLRLQTAPKAVVFAYVYADGYTPGRVCWIEEEPVRVVLAKRTARLQIEIKDDVSTIYVRRAGTFDNEQVAYPAKGLLELEVAPGSYEVTLYRKGPVAAVKAVTLGIDDRVVLAMDADQRPTIEVELPELRGEGAWWVHGSRRALGGMVAKRAIWTERGGPMPTRELSAEVEEKGARHFLLRLPTSGRYTLFVGHESLEHRLFREVVVALGQHYRISLPPLDGVLQGSIDAMPESWAATLPVDGIAGPRLWLEPAGSTAFGALVTLPGPQEFRLAQLPRGEFALHHHLYSTTSAWSLRNDQGSWGAVALRIGDADADVGALGRGPDGALSVKVTLLDGRPAVGVLSVRDRMHESWQQVMRSNSTLVFAADHIPHPPSARLVAGKATLEKIRAGSLCFELLSDDGATYYFSREVAPGTELEIKLRAGN